MLSVISRSSLQSLIAWCVLVLGFGGGLQNDNPLFPQALYITAHCGGMTSVYSVLGCWCVAAVLLVAVAVRASSGSTVRCGELYNLV